MQMLLESVPDASAILEALSAAVLVIDANDVVRQANSSAEQILQTSRHGLIGQRLDALIPADSPLHALARQVRGSVASIADHGIPLETPRVSIPAVSVQLSPVLDADGRDQGWIVLSISPHTIAQRVDQQLLHRHAGRSVAAMAALLAHEVKNPLASIRGAAQLLEMAASAEDQELVTLICDEVDRINGLVERMGLVADPRGLERGPVNIHEVLERARRIAETGFGEGIRLIERYDPSLPPAFGHRDQLIQVFVNLLKNACEVVSRDRGEIVLSTAYEHGVRLMVPGAAKPVDLPLVVRIQDNGPGVPDDMRAHLFDPFVSAKPGGHGLGLALVAKIVSEHGGLVECDSEPGRTVFTVMLPVAAGTL
ncbi:MAG: PAS domain-containing protein [Alphaproteobacteria bacterium]|nr:PAS domain-containing protein [Alphaproteobacteria bacterium]